MTTINAGAVRHASFNNVDTSDAIQEVRDALLKAAPNALERLDRIALEQRTQDGLKEQDRREAAALIEKKDALRRNIAFFDSDDFRHAATEEQIASADRDRKKVVRYIKEIAALQSKKYPGTMLGRIEQTLAGLIGVTFRPVEVKVPSDADKMAARLEKVRGAIDEFHDSRADTESAPVTVAEAKARARAQLDALIKRGRPGVGGLYRVRKNDASQVVQGKITFPVTPNSTEHNPQVDVQALFTWLHRDLFMAEIEKLIDAQEPDFPVALAKRPAMLAEIDAEILALEYEEGALIDALEVAGRKVQRRHNMNVLAALGVEIAEPAPKKKHADRSLIQVGSERPVQPMRN